MNIEMKLNDYPYKQICSGNKNIELRLYDEKRRKIKVGDTITFTNTISNEQMTVSVKELYTYSSFFDLFSNISLVDCGFEKGTSIEYAIESMREYYTKEQEEQYGVIGIRIEKL